MEELNRLGAMQPEADRVLQDLVDDARGVFCTEFCMVKLVTADTQFFKVWSGEMPPEVAAVRWAPREHTMCRHVPRAGGAAGALADGLPDKEISENLHVGIETVRNHLVSVFGSLGVNPLVFALRQGVVQIG